MISYTFSGHETFSLRHGWLKKGIDGVSDKSNFFSNERAMIELGVGKNMVQSIRRGLNLKDKSRFRRTLGKFGAVFFARTSLDGFILTTSGRIALYRFADSFAGARPTRAWTVTTLYGSEKLIT